MKVVIFIVLMAVALVAGCAEQGEQIKIGVILPLTGSGSDQGEWARKGLELAKDEINSNGGVHSSNIELIYEDNKGSNPQESLNAYQKLRTSDIPAVLTYGSSTGIVLTKEVNADKVIQMGIATASPDYSTPNDYTFRVFPSSTLEGAFDANLVFNRLNVSKVAVIYIQNDFGVGSKNSFIEKFKELGGTVVAEEPVEPGITDARTQLSKIKSQNPEAVFLAVYPREGGIAIKQARETGLDIQFIASTAILDGKEFFDITGDAAEGLLVTTGQFDPNVSEEARQFADKYNRIYGSMPEVYSARAFDGLKVLAYAMNSCENPKDTMCIKDFLLSMKNYSGATGKISFDINGDIEANFQVLIARNQTFVRYD